MAYCNRTLAIKAALGAGFLLILLNLLNSKLDSTSGAPRLKSGTTQWPKRTHSTSEKHSASLGGLSADNDGNENIFAQHSNDTDNATLQRGQITSNYPNHQPNGFTAGGQQNQPVDLDDAALQHNNSQTQNVIRNFPHASTNRTVTTSENEVSSNSSNRNESKSTILKASISKVKTRFENDIVGKKSSTIETVNIANSSQRAIPVKLNAFVNASSRVVANPDAEETSSEIISRRKQIPDRLVSLIDKFTINMCPPIPPNLDGPIDVDMGFEPISAVEKRFSAKLEPGGHYKPPDCTARNRVAIIVPYRDREQHLPIFLKNIHSLLIKQQLEYGIYLVEQTAGSSFNRAALMNVGFVEAMKQKNWECMVFHDIDLLPMDDRNLYTCPDQPRHMSVAVDTFGFKLPYSTIFGGVSAMTEKQFRTVNGFSNSFWGWGGEDDDMSNRLKHVGFHIARYPVNIARYTMLSHKKEKANPKRYEKLVNGAKRFDSDGLNSLHYQLVNLIRKPLYTWIHVDILPDAS